jgi:hypothetical protein
MKPVYDLKDFKNFCSKGICLRGTLINKNTCITGEKQDKCFEKYLSMLERKRNKLVKKVIENNEIFEKEKENNFANQLDLKWEETKLNVWKRDVGDTTPIYRCTNWLKYCAIWNYVLSYNEKTSIMNMFFPQLYGNYYLSNLHIKSKNFSPELKYDVNNIIIAGNYFHELYDNYRDLVTQEYLGSKDFWQKRFEDYVLHRLQQ